MNKGLEDKIFALTRKLKDEPDGRNKHFTFIVRRSRILSVGYNGKKTHPKAARYGYRFDAIHSELSAVLKFNGKLSDIRGCTLINTRINSLGNIGYSKPCVHCLFWITRLGLKSIYYTGLDGLFQELDLKEV